MNVKQTIINTLRATKYKNIETVINYMEKHGFFTYHCHHHHHCRHHHRCRFVSGEIVAADKPAGHQRIAPSGCGGSFDLLRIKRQDQYIIFIAVVIRKHRTGVSANFAGLERIELETQFVVVQFAVSRTQLVDHADKFRFAESHFTGVGRRFE